MTSRHRKRHKSGEAGKTTTSTPVVGDLLATAAKRHLRVGGSATGVWLRSRPPWDSLRQSSRGDHPPPPPQPIRAASPSARPGVWGQRPRGLNHPARGRQTRL